MSAGNSSYYKPTIKHPLFPAGKTMELCSCPIRDNNCGEDLMAVIYGYHIWACRLMGLSLWEFHTQAVPIFLCALFCCFSPISQYPVLYSGSHRYPLISPETDKSSSLSWSLTLTVSSVLGIYFVKWQCSVNTRCSVKMNKLNVAVSHFLLHCNLSLVYIKYKLLMTSSHNLISNSPGWFLNVLGFI